FAGSPGSDEIMADLEARIAELFPERIRDRGRVVTLADVDHVIGVMGRPEDYPAGEDPAMGEAPRPGGRRYKRLYRDPDDRWVGGVLSGLAAYAGIDPLWFRVAFILLLVLGVGSPILLYIILWILIPVASTPAERLMMDGEPVTVDNLKRAFEQGAHRVASEVEDMGRRWDREAPRAARSFSSGAKRAASSASSVLKRIFGMVLLAIGLSLGLSLVGTVIGGSILTFFTSSGDDVGVVDLAAITFATPAHATWSMVALLLVMAVPVAAILIAGFQLLLDLHAPKWLGWVLGTVWVVALAATVVAALRLANDIKRSGPVHVAEELHRPAGDLLFLRRYADVPERKWSMSYRNGRFDGDLAGLRIADDSIHGAWARLDIRRSPDAAYHLLVERRAQGATGNNAMRRADHITWRAHQQDSILYLSPGLAWPKADRLRGQRATFVVQVPEGGSVHIDGSLAHMLHDVHNTGRVRDRDMVDRTWTMTAKGLTSAADARAPRKADDHPAPAEHDPATPHSDSSSTGRDRGDAAHADDRPVRTGLVARGYRMPDLLTLLRPRI
ncbi:MAG: PspC domain-containing protein, partial [Flavobacteriales bacterium]|nr:PspC domain-containing protein [Flavobacteriales bacterium]